MGPGRKRARLLEIPALLFHDLREDACRSLQAGRNRGRDHPEHKRLENTQRKRNEREHVTEKSHVFAVTVTLWTDRLPRAKSSIRLDFSAAYDLADGGYTH